MSTETHNQSLFDLGKSPEQKKKEEQEAKKKAAQEERQKNQSKAQKDAQKRREEQERKRKEEENRAYPAGTAVKYINSFGREETVLERDMKKSEIIEMLQDEYPEVTADKAEFRYDADKKRVVVYMGSQKKG